MSQYKRKFNPVPGTSLVPVNAAIRMRDTVANQAALPLSGNVIGDGRVTIDNGHLYVWSIDSATGLLTDWIDQGNFIDVSWDSLSGKPSSTPSNIDDAVSKRHTQGTDQGLDTGGLNATTAAQVKQAVDDIASHKDANTGVHGLTGAVVGSDDGQVLTNKVIIAADTIKGQYRDVSIFPYPFTSVSYYDGSSFTDLTDEAKSRAGTPFILLSDNDDEFYVGIDNLNYWYGEIYFALDTVGVGITLVVEYFNDLDQWVDIGLIDDGTLNLTQSGKLFYNNPSDWKDVEINGYLGKFVRIRTTTNPSQNPTAFCVSPYETVLGVQAQEGDGLNFPLEVKADGKVRIRTVLSDDTNEASVADIKDAIDKEHVHTNISILDNIEEALTTALKSAYDACVTFIANFNLGTPNVDDCLRWNGSQFVPSAPQQTGFTGVSLFLDDTSSGISSFFTLSNIPAIGVEVLDSITVNANTVHGEDYISGVLGGTQIDAGVWEFDIYRYISTGDTAGTTELIFEVYKRTSGGTETLLFSIATGDVNDTSNTLQTLTTVQPAFAINSTDRLLLKTYGHRIQASNRTITFTHNGTSHYSHIHTPLILRHNDLAGLQGGTSGEYNHLTNSELSDVQGITDIALNVMLNAFRIAQIGSLTIFQMVKGFMDEYEDESGVDIGSSSGIVYDSTNDFYKNYEDIDAETVLLLHFDNNVTDSELTPKTVTNNGVTFSSSIKKFGSHSGIFNGGYLTVPDSADWDLGTNDFTIDCWIQLGAQGIRLCNIGNYDSNGLGIYFNSPNISVTIANVGYSFSGGGISTGVWYHFALVRNGTDLKCFLNGTQYGSTESNSANISCSSAIGIGTWSDLLSENWDGYIDEFRISKGIARWTSNFTPPVTQYPLSGNMILQSNAQVATIVPTSSRIILFEEDVDSVTLNTDLKAYISRDDGTTFSQVTLEDEGNYITGARILSGVVDISGQPSGSNIKYQVETLNDKKLNIHGTAVSWK